MAGPLTIRFATDVEPARRGIASLRADMVSNLNQTNMALTQSAGAADTFGNALSSLRAPIDGVLTGLAALQATKQVIGTVADALSDAEGRMARTLQLAQGAQGVGVGTSVFQILTAQAKALGLEATSLVAILAKAQDASRVKLGVGNDAKNESGIGKILREDVQVGNISKADESNFTSQTSQEERIKAILNLMDKLKEEGKTLAAEDIGRNFFGEDFITRVRNGVDLVGALRKSLEGANVAGGVRVVSDEEVARTTAMQAKIAEINDLYAQGTKPILDDIAYLQDRAADASLEWQKRVAELVAKFADVYNYVKSIVAEAANFAKSAAQAVGIIGPDQPAEEGDKPLPVRIRNKRKVDTSVARPGPARKESGGSEEQDAVEALIRQINKARDVQLAELAAVGKTVVEREKLVALARAEAAARDDFEKGRRSSPTLDADERTRALAAAEAYGKAKAATVDLEQAQKGAADTAKYFGQTLTDSLADALIDGRSLSDVFSNLTKTLERAALQAALLGTGPLASLFGTAPLASAGSNATGGLLGSLLGGFGSNAANAPGPGAQGPTAGGGGFLSGLASLFGSFGGGHADGGDIDAGKWALVGEKGPELIAASATARTVIPNGGTLARAPASSARNTSTSIDMGERTYNITPANGVTPAQLQATLEHYDRESFRALPGRLRQARAMFD